MGGNLAVVVTPDHDATVEIRWTSKAHSDVVRLYAFLAPLNPRAAAHAARALTKAPEVLLVHPRIGEQLFQFEPREIRRLLVGKYEMRYEVQGASIYILRVWHTREFR